MRLVALVVQVEESDEPAVFCMEEPENGIRPGDPGAVNDLLHDIAIDVNEPAGIDNPLRQVIVAARFPWLVQLQGPDHPVVP